MIDETETLFCSSSSNNANNGMNKGRTTLNFIKDPLLTSTSAATVVCMDAYKNMGLENDDNNGDKMKALTEGDPYSIDPALYNEAARRRELILRRVRCLEQGAAVTVLLPSGQTIAENVQLNNFLGEATRGQRILLCGPEGTGKSTLLRTLADVWPFVRVDAGRGGGASPTRKHQGNPVDVDFGTLSTRPGGYGGSFELENKPSLSLKPKKEPARILDFVFRYSATEGLKLFPKSLAEAESEDEDDKHDLDTPTRGCRSTTSKLNAASRRRDLQNEHQRLPYLIPQRGPGLPYPMTFREAICFPDSSSAYSDREIYTALKKVRLSLEGKRRAKEASSSSSSTYGGNSGGGAGGSSNGTNASKGAAMNSEAELRDYVDDDEEFLVGGASNSGAGGYNYDDSFSGGAARSPTDFMDEQEKSIGLDTAVDVAQVLSGGELQRLMVAHCLLAKPRVLLLDEALVHLSDENQRWIYELLSQELVQHPTVRTTLITVSHEWRKLISCHDAFFTIKEKKIVTFDAVAEAKEI
ncbi:unnamed protein product [Amoebophrya sp. A25]|nr:unnamed protein product [Amoebophrya sp. A25]|eukprot:GSA25T00016392001.1